MRRKIFVVVIVLLLFLPVFTHAKDTIRAIDILNRIKKGEHILIEDAIIEGELDFTLAAEMKKTFEYEDTYYYEGYINSRISFVNCEIEEEIRFSAYEGRNSFDVIFTRAVSFNNCGISGIYCSGAEFTGGIYVVECYITEEVRFSSVEFYNYSFIDTKFFKEVDFSNCDFFINKRYGSKIMLGFFGTVFKAKAIFSYNDVYEEFNFRHVAFEVEPEFSNISFKDGAEAKFKGATLNGEPYDPFSDEEDEEGE